MGNGNSQLQGNQKSHDDDEDMLNTWRNSLRMHLLVGAESLRARAENHDLTNPNIAALFMDATADIYESALRAHSGFQRKLEADQTDQKEDVLIIDQSNEKKDKDDEQ